MELILCVASRVSYVIRRYVSLINRGLLGTLMVFHETYE